MLPSRPHRHLRQLYRRKQRPRTAAADRAEAPPLKQTKRGRLKAPFYQAAEKSRPPLRRYKPRFTAT
ncbi:hypothetical protein DPQ22_01470 [Candidatus Tokpelaia sp.]|nr:hypothetical protein DPQ22_01470 [Candidatus Tokpelaia sp.]